MKRASIALGILVTIPVVVFILAVFLFAWFLGKDAIKPHALGGPRAIVEVDDELRTVVKAIVEEMNHALIEEDFSKVADFTHPNVHKLMGGREKMIAQLKSGNMDMKLQGYVIRSVTVDEPSEPVSAGSDLFIVVPFLLEMKARGGRIFQKSSVIGVSSDQGKSWVFVNGDLDIKTVKKALPNLPDQVTLPERHKPSFESD